MLLSIIAGKVMHISKTFTDNKTLTDVVTLILAWRKGGGLPEITAGHPVVDFRYIRQRVHSQVVTGPETWVELHY